MTPSEGAHLLTGFTEWKINTSTLVERSTPREEEYQRRSLMYSFQQRLQARNNHQYTQPSDPNKTPHVNILGPPLPITKTVSLPAVNCELSIAKLTIPQTRMLTLST
jgi:hypothetical protein